MSRVVRGDWALWVDWCAATGRDPHQATIPDLTAFLLEVPATPGVQDRRVRSITRTLTGTGHTLPRPTTTVPVRIGPQWVSHGDALGVLRQEWYPEGVAARRDALILVLTGAGCTRTRITNLRAAQIDVDPDVVVDGVDLPRHVDPVLCPRCAVVRWLQVLDAFADRSRADVEDLLTQARDYSHPRHDCADPVADRWRQARWVIPAIDRHGAIAPATPITGRALTAGLARRYNTAAVRAATGTGQPNRPTPGLADIPMRHRPGREEHEQLTKLWERADKAADELNARILQLLEDL